MLHTEDEKFEDASLEDNERRTNNGADTNNPEVCKVGIRIPPFWPEEPEIWFAQVEGQFVISGITSDSTKFNYVIGQLENRYSREVKDIIINPPPDKKYEKLKTELIKRLTTTNEKKLKQLLMHEELGDRKPSQFLRHLTGLAGTGVPSDFLKTIWVNRLPHHIQTVLAGQPSTATLDSLADLADRVNDITSSTSSVAATSTQYVPGSIVSELTQEIAELRKQVRNLTIKSNANPRRARSRSRKSGNNRSHSRSQSSYKKFPICWYHFKYGEKAHTCSRPCDFKAENLKGSR